MKKKLFLLVVILSVICGFIGVYLKVNNSDKTLSNVFLALAVIFWFTIIVQIIRNSMQRRTS
jgi:uncharacterized membrane protein YfcA